MPWAIIIPESEASEFHDLPIPIQNTVTAIAQQIDSLFRSEYAIEKINFAAIGNVVSQLHVHVVGRHANDPLWPDVVWGRTLPEASYSQADISLIKTQLQQALTGLSL